MVRDAQDHTYICIYIYTYTFLAHFTYVLERIVSKWLDRSTCSVFGNMQLNSVSQKLGLPHQVCCLACCACPMLFHIHRPSLLIFWNDGLRIPTAVQFHRRDVRVHFILLQVFLQMIAMQFVPNLWIPDEHKDRRKAILKTHIYNMYMYMCVYIYILYIYIYLLYI